MRENKNKKDAVWKKLMANIRYSMGRNKVSGRPVKAITITGEDLKNIFLKQDGKCYWSGLPLKEEYSWVKHHPFAMSVDRLDNKEGYTTENIVLTRRLFNLGRMSFGHDEFKDVVQTLVEELKKKV